MKQGGSEQANVASSKITQVIGKSIAVPTAVYYLWLFISQIPINMQEIEREFQSVSNPSVRTCN